MIETKEKDLIDVACTRYKEVKNSGATKFNTLDSWLDKESTIFKKETKKNNNINHKIFKRGQIIKVDFGINLGAEICYTHFAIVLTKQDSINSDNLTVVPITSKIGKYNKRLNLGKILMIIYPNSKKYNLTCYVNVSQIKTISKSRIFMEKKCFVCNDEILDKIDDAIILEFTNKKLENCE